MGKLHGTIDIDPADDMLPQVVPHSDGGLSLDVDGEVTLRFPSLAAYDAWQETVDRSRRLLPTTPTDVAEYQARVRELRDEKRRVVGR